MKGNAKQYSKGGKADVQYYRLLLHTCTEFPLQLVELNYPSRLGLDNLLKRQKSFYIEKNQLLVYLNDL